MTSLRGHQFDGNSSDRSEASGRRAANEAFEGTSAARWAGSERGWYDMNPRKGGSRLYFLASLK